MGIIVNIANTPIDIKGPDFLKNLTSIERRLLQPFIGQRSLLRKSAKPFAVNIKIIKEARVVKSKPFDPLLVNKIKKYLACPSHSKFHISGKLELYLKNFFYSDRNQFKKFVDILISMGNGSKIMPGDHWLSIFNKESYASYVFLHRRRQSDEMSMFYLSLLKLLFFMIIAEEGGALLHASSVDDKGSGYVFAGPGNSGKSTTVKMGRFNRILSDDTAVIRKINHSYMVFPNPWCNVDSNMGITSFLNPVPLRAIFFIKKAKKTSMRHVCLKKILAGLICGDGNFKQLSFYADKYRVKNYYKFLMLFINNVPIFELRIKKGPEFKQEFLNLLCRYVKK